jgi:Flp pilus assembly protein TadG
MRRLKDERGAVAVTVALLMVPLIGFAAISLDVAGLWWEKQQLHTGADAAALAIAQDCSKAASTCTTGGAATTAQTLAAGNHPKGAVTATVTSLSTTQVTVSASATRADLFAPVLGVRSSTVNASATVAWGAPSGGTAVLPLAFSWCEWSQQTGGGLPSGTTSRVIYLTKTSSTTCTGPSNNIVPGGFGWLTVNSGTCGTKTSIGNTIASDPGNSVPNGCSTSSFSSLVGTTVLLPLFDSYAGSGSNATYRVYGYAAFQLTGYFFGGQYSAGTDTCSGNARCVSGYFTRFVSLTEAFTYSAGAPALGASVITLKS